MCMPLHQMPKYVCTHIPAYTCSYVSDYGCEAFKPLCQHNLLRAPHTKPSRSCPPAAVEWQATKEQKGISLSVEYPDGEPLGWTCIQPKVPWPWHLCDLTCGNPTVCVCVSLSLCLCVHLRAHVSVCVYVCACVHVCAPAPAPGESLCAAAEAWTSADEFGQTLAKRKQVAIDVHNSCHLQPSSVWVTL